jgi:hypothetical protein
MDEFLCGGHDPTPAAIAPSTGLLRAMLNPRGTIAETYLQRRGQRLPEALA